MVILALEIILDPQYKNFFSYLERIHMYTQKQLIKEHPTFNPCVCIMIKFLKLNIFTPHIILTQRFSNTLQKINENFITQKYFQTQNLYFPTETFFIYVRNLLIHCLGSYTNNSYQQKPSYFLPNHMTRIKFLKITKKESLSYSIFNFSIKSSQKLSFS